MSVRFSVVVAALAVVLSGGNAVAADITIRSVPYEPPKQQPAVVAKPARVEQMPIAAAMAECPCGRSLACVGPKGGRYCVTPAGKKRYY